MVQFGRRAIGTGIPSQHAGSFEDVTEMIPLANVNDVQNAIGVEIVGAVANGGQIGGGIQESTITLADDHRSIAIGEVHHNGAVVFSGFPRSQE